jgi:ubiquinone/menaquinone biosynthesis C-methylase UbiE
MTIFQYCMTYYDDIAEGYEELHREEQQKKIEVIKQYLRPLRTEKLLDVGCGTGLTTEPWKCRRYGIDPARRLIARARQPDRIEYKVAPAEHIPYPDLFFDYVISITALQNFEAIEKGLREIRRVGKDKFVLTALKKSPKIKKITGLIEQYFNVDKIIEEEKDIIFLIGL